MYCNEDRVVISCGWDHTIRIHDEESMDGELLREVANAHGADILCVAHSYCLGVMATGCRLGEVRWRRADACCFWRVVAARDCWDGFWVLRVCVSCVCLGDGVMDQCRP